MLAKKKHPIVMTPEKKPTTAEEIEKARKTQVALNKKLEEKKEKKKKNKSEEKLNEPFEEDIW